MTTREIEEQINAIRELTKKAAASPEYALEILRRVGITEPTKKTIPNADVETEPSVTELIQQ